MTATRISDEHLEHYETHGYAIVKNFLTAEDLAMARGDIEACIHGWVDYCDDPDAAKPPPAKSTDVSEFPYRGQTLNRITLHPELRRFAQIHMGDEEIYCEQSHLHVKHQDHSADSDQIMLMDYGNHTLAYPPKSSKYWQTAFLIYYTDVTEDHAPTAVCPWQHYQEGMQWPSSYSRQDNPLIYDNEIKVVAPAGSLLIYSMRTFHRGTRFNADVGRIGQFVTYAPKNYRWLGIVGWPRNAIRKEFTPWIEQASVAERTTLGFPAPGDDYWDEETIAGVNARYPGMDMTPYLEQT